jgi:cytochrome c oxidase subunit II
MNQHFSPGLKMKFKALAVSCALSLPLLASAAEPEAGGGSMDLLMTGLKLLLLVTVVLSLNILRMVFNLRSTDPLESVNFNNLNSNIMVGFIFVGLCLGVFFSFYYQPLYLPEASSNHGMEIDKMFNLTLAVTGIVVIITHLVLLYFVFKYRWNDNRKALYYPDNNKLEMMWTIAPAIVLTVLVLDGTKNWNAIMQPPPADAIEIELTGKQFAWNIRYAGPDNEFGKTNFRMISAENELGFDWEDSAGKDDVMPGEIYMPVNRAVLLKIRARDVLHSVYLPHFRVKMDAVPGMPTQFCFTPNKTTKEMRAKLGNENFNYELACTEICGRGHFSMKRTVVVVTEEEYNEWLRKQKAYFKPAEEVAPLATDSVSGDSLSTQPQAPVEGDVQAAPNEKPSKAKKDKLAVAGKIKKQANSLLTSN